jgi:hypothetical protein
MPVKRVLCPERLRRVPESFSWVDHRLVRDEHIRRCSSPALALYLFLVTVGDAEGLSYYSERSLCGWLALNEASLQRARRELLEARLIAYEHPLYQVLALDPVSVAMPLRTPQAEPLALKQILGAMLEGRP